MSRTIETDNPELLAAWSNVFGVRAVEWQPTPSSDWRCRCVANTPAKKFAEWMMGYGYRYRIVLPDAAPIPDGLPSDAVPVPWFEHEAWVVPPDTPYAKGFEVLTLLGRSIRWYEFAGGCAMPAVVRRKPEPPQPKVEEITPTPETLHRLVGRVTADGDTIRRVEQTATGWSAWFDDGGSFHLSGDWSAGARVLLLAEDGAR